MSKLSSFIHAHASVFKVGTEVLGVAIAELPVPAALKDPLMGVLVEMNKTANNMGDNANAVAENLLSELGAGATATTSTNPTIQAGLQAVSVLASTAATVLSSTGGTPANTTTVSGAAPLPSAPAPTTQVYAPPPAPTQTPAGQAPVAATVAPPAPPQADPAANLAPATAVSLGLATDPNSAHAGPPGTDPNAPAPTPTTPQPLPADAPSDPGLATTAADPYATAEAQMTAALAAGDRAGIEAAAQALAAAAAPSPQ